MRLLRFMSPWVFQAARMVCSGLIIVLSSLSLIGCQMQPMNQTINQTNSLPQPFAQLETYDVQQTVPDVSNHPVLWIATSKYCQSCHALLTFLQTPQARAKLQRYHVQTHVVRVDDKTPTTQKALKLFQVTLTPTAVLIAKGGKVKHVFFEVPTLATLESYLKDLSKHVANHGRHARHPRFSFHRAMSHHGHRH